MNFVSGGWLWIYAGLALVLLELVTPGFILCFFGLSAMTVGFVRLLVGDAFDATWCAGAFSVLAVLYIVLLRRALKKVFMGEKDAASLGLSDDFAGRAGTVAEAIGAKGGIESVNMQLAQQYLTQFGNLAKTNNTMIIPSNLADVAGVLKACTSVVKKID